MAATRTATPWRASFAAAYPMRPMFVSRSSAKAQPLGEVRADLVTVEQLESVPPLEQARREGPRHSRLPCAREPGEPDHKASLRRHRLRSSGRLANDLPVPVWLLVGASQHLRDLGPHEVRQDRFTGAQH